MSVAALIRGRSTPARYSLAGPSPLLTSICRPPSIMIVRRDIGRFRKRKCGLRDVLASAPHPGCEMIRWRDSSSNASSSGHRIGPGATALTRLRRKPRASESKPHQPRLGDAVENVVPERPLGVDVGDVDDRPGDFLSTGAAAWAMNKGARRSAPIGSPNPRRRFADRRLMKVAALLTVRRDGRRFAPSGSTSDGSLPRSSRRPGSAPPNPCAVIELRLQ
jgi:hypothetical protein